MRRRDVRLLPHKRRLEDSFPLPFHRTSSTPCRRARAIKGSESRRLRKPTFVQEAEQVEDIALAAHVGSDQHIQWSQRKVNISQAFEIPRAHSRNHKDTETMIPLSAPIQIGRASCRGRVEM